MGLCCFWEDWEDWESVFGGFGWSVDLQPLYVFLYVQKYRTTRIVTAV
jgi:hypothetical protein